jgi:hypothetical protein
MWPFRRRPRPAPAPVLPDATLPCVGGPFCGEALGIPTGHPYLRFAHGAYERHVATDGRAVLRWVEAPRHVRHSP